MTNPTDQIPFDIQDTDLYQACSRSAGKKRITQLTQKVYEDAMERAINAVKARATVDGPHGPIPTNIGALEVEIAIRRELTPLAGGQIEFRGPGDVPK